jgi:hypothetical protein
MNEREKITGENVIWHKDLQVISAIILALVLAITGFFIGDSLDSQLNTRTGTSLATGVFFLFGLSALWLINRMVIKLVWGVERDEIFAVLILLTGLFMVRKSPDILTAIGCLGVFCAGGYYIFYLHPRFSPLSKEEESDPPKREVILQIPYDNAFLLGEQAIQSLNGSFHFWEISESDRGIGRIVGKERLFKKSDPSWEVSISLKRISGNATSIHISCNPLPPVIFPLLARRRQITGLNSISAYLKNNGNI